MHYNSQVDVCRLMVSGKLNVKLGGFRSKLEASCMSCYTEELWCNERVCLWMAIYIFIFIYIYTKEKHIRKVYLKQWSMLLLYVCKAGIKPEKYYKLTKERSRRYPAKTITETDYADDIALLANTPAQAETLLHSLERTAAGSMSMHTKRYICALIKLVTSPH